MISSAGGKRFYRRCKEQRAQEGSHDVRSVAIKGDLSQLVINRGCWAGVQHLNPGCWPVWVVVLRTSLELIAASAAGSVCLFASSSSPANKAVPPSSLAEDSGFVIFPSSFGFAHGESVVVHCHF